MEGIFSGRVRRKWEGFKYFQPEKTVIIEKTQINQSIKITDMMKIA